MEGLEASVGVLVNYVDHATRNSLPRVTLAAMLDGQGSWNWSTFQQLPVLILLRIATVVEPRLSFPRNKIGWSLSSDKRFTIRSSYDRVLD
ncbi:hypothetical protein V6N13_038830 [Hibiscus sabdariffa]